MAAQPQLTAKDKIFVAAARKLGALTDEQLRECTRLAFDRRELGVEKELGDVALDKGFLAPEKLKQIMALVQKAQIKTADGRTPSKPELTPPGGMPKLVPAAASAPAPAAAKKSSGSGEQDLIDGYSIHDKLGEGAMAMVFRARHKVLDKEVALKVLSPEFSNNPDYVARFLREARAAARIAHPNVVQIHDAGESRGRHFIAMELVEGATLEKLVARDGPLSEIAALEAAQGVAHALEAASAEKIVHRDVKPANIVRTPDGRIKLLDLGLARTHHRRGEDGYITDHGRTLGTPFYVSPEQARGEELDSRSDIYSLGVTLFYLVTGDHPFTGTTAPEVMRKHIQDPIPSARMHRPSLSAQMDTLLQKMLAKDARRRYQSPRELVEAFALLISGEVLPKDEPPSGEAEAVPTRAERERAEKAERRAARRDTPKEKPAPRPARVAASPEPTGPRPPPFAGGAAAAAIARAKVPPSTVKMLAFACAGLAMLLVLLVAIQVGITPADATAGGSGGRADRPRVDLDETAAGKASPKTPSSKPERFPAEFAIGKKRADELAAGGDPQGALQFWKKLYPLESRETGALKGAIEREERAIQDGIEKRFQQDLANANQQMKGGHFRIAQRIFERVKLYGGLAEKARAEQELLKLDAAEEAYKAAGKSVAAGSRDRDTFVLLLHDLAPLVHAGKYEDAGDRADDVGATMKDPAFVDAAKDAGKLLRELKLLDDMAENAVAQLAGFERDFGLSTGQTISGKIIAIERGGKVIVEAAGPGGNLHFQIAQLTAAEKESLASLARGKGGELERLLAIHELYRGQPDEALLRAERLGAEGLLEHVKLVASLAPRAAPPAPAAPAPSVTQAPPTAAPAAPPPPPAPAAPIVPLGSKFERALAAILKAPLAIEQERAFTADYAWTAGSGTEESLKDFTAQKPPFKTGFTQKGLVIETKQVGKFVHKVPLTQPYELTATIHFETKSPQSTFVVTIAEGKGGTGFGVDCGQTLFRRSRGEIVQWLKKVPNPPADYLKSWADINVRVFVDKDEVTVEVDGKKTIDKVKIKDGDGLIGFEAGECKVAIRNLKIKASPNPEWILEEMKKIRD